MNTEKRTKRIVRVPICRGDAKKKMGTVKLGWCLEEGSNTCSFDRIDEILKQPPRFLLER